MLNLLITGVLQSVPEHRADHRGAEYITARMVGYQDGGAIWGRVMAFDPEPAAALKALAVGDSVAVVGHAAIEVYQGKDGKHKPAFRLVADKVSTVYEAAAKKRKVQEVQV